jgi:hypothetical protein
MKRCVHLVVGDLRRMRWWAAIWLVALAAPVLWAWFVTAFGNSARLESVVRNAGLIVIAQAVLAYALVLVLMQADPAIGTRQFWLTRPIGPGRLFLSKLAAALTILGGGAVAVGLPWWIWHGADAAQVGQRALEFLLLALALIGPAMLISALTDTLGRAVLWSFAQFALVLGLMAPIGVALNPAKIGQDGVLLRMGWTLALWWWLALGVAWGLYVTRRRGWTVWPACGVIAVPVAVGVLAPERIGADSGMKALQPEMGAAVRVALRDAWSTPVRTGEPLPSTVPLDQVRMSFTVEGYPRGELALVGLAAEQQWSWPGLTVRRGHALSSMANRELPGFRALPADSETEAHQRQERERLRARRAARGRTLADPPPAPDVPWLMSHGLEPSSLPARMAREAARYEGRLWLGLARPTLVNQVPLRVGATHAAGGLRIRVTAIGSNAAQQTVEFLRSEPVFIARGLAENLDRMRQRRPAGRVDPVALHPGRKEQRMLSAGRERVAWVHGVEIAHWMAVLTTGRVRRNGAWAEPETWREGAVLAHVTWEFDSVFAREVKAEPLTLTRNVR